MTPMMQQYLSVKAQYPDTILFYRLGDFYEMFFEDAKLASKELELTLTGRDCGEAEKAPMCGVPFHAAENYIARLVAKGYKVAVCEQMEEPSQAKGTLKREVVRVLTAGTVIESNMLDSSKNNYLGAIYLDDQAAGLVFCDVSTGEIHVSFHHGVSLVEDIKNEVARFSPSELIVNYGVTAKTELMLALSGLDMPRPESIDEMLFDYEKACVLIQEQFASSIEELSLSEKPQTVKALGATLAYLKNMQKNDLQNISSIDISDEENTMQLDVTARRNLELTESIHRREGKGSLLWVLDQTETAMGKRLMRSYVENPLTNLNAIQLRLNCVGELFEQPELLESIRESLSDIHDFERILTRIVYGTANAREIRALGNDLEKLPHVKSNLKTAKGRLMCEINEQMETLEDVLDLIDRAILEEPANSVREGGMIKTTYNEELKELTEIVNGGKEFLTKIEEEEKQKTNIKKLKIGYNRVFGYYIEVPNSYKSMVPESYIRKQTLANGERYITGELKELETKMLGAQERIYRLEYELFTEVREKIASQQERIKKTAESIAKLDVFSSLAYVALQNGYARPIVNETDRICIKDGRHPVVEKFLKESPFVPNDTLLDCGENRTVIITGPNMAGKSTYMRQVALITIMAQIGSFVPAKSAELGIVDRIFTRIGAADDLSMGQSTFMTEMNEVSYILKNATSASLIILDEIGRGTSTYDGMSIARAVLEYITNKKKIGAKTLFATHYHELTELENSLDGVKNFNIAVKKRGDSVVFLRKIVKGGADRSYGIDVAGLAGLPAKVIERARQILKELESNEEKPTIVRAASEISSEPQQMSMSAGAESIAAERLRNAALDTLTPLEALNLLYELKALLQ